MIMTKDVNGNLTYSGGDRDVIDELFQRLHLTYVNLFIRINKFNIYRVDTATSTSKMRVDMSNRSLSMC